MHYPYDLHTHTKLSDGWGDVRGNVRSAEACGMEVVAITDHYWGDDPNIVDKLLDQVRRARQESPIRVLAGLEGYVLDARGRISVDAGVAERLDLLLVDFGGKTKGIGCDAPRDKVHALEAVVSAVAGLSQVPYLDIWAHPLNLGWLDCPLELDDLSPSALKEMAAALAEGGVAFEIMNQFHYWWPAVPVSEVTRRYIEIVALFAEEGVRFSMGSDAHRVGGVGNLAWSLQVAVAAGITDEMMFVPD